MMVSRKNACARPGRGVAAVPAKPSVGARAFFLAGTVQFFDARLASANAASHSSALFTSTQRTRAPAAPKPSPKRSPAPPNEPLPENREPLSLAGGVEQVEHVAVRRHLPRGDREPTSRIFVPSRFGEERSDDARRQTRAVFLVRAAAVPEKRPRLAAAALAVRDDDGVEAPVQPVRDVAPHRVGDAAARSDAVQAVPAGAAAVFRGVRRC
jgi:hypothetical protein